MVRSHQRWNVSLAAAWIAAFSLVAPDRSLAEEKPPERRGLSLSPSPSLAPSPWPWPCQLIVIGELRAGAELAWEHSPTFRDQCRKLAAAGARMVVEPVTSRETWRATTRIAKTEDGVTLAVARVRPAKNTLELIAHELEHVLEFADGVKFLMEARASRSGVKLSGGAYETRRAIDAGHRVAQEVRDRAQNSTRNPNCH